MQKINDIMKKVIENTDILMNGAVISKDLLLENFGKFMVENGLKEGHKVGVVMHTGTICFDIISLTYAALWCLLLNESSNDNLINSLAIGDMVLYGQKKKGRYIFNGIIDGNELMRDYAGKKYIKLTQDNGMTQYVPEMSWRLIEPYKGNSTRADGRGIKKKSNNREKFFVEVLDYERMEIPSVIETSCVFVMPRDKADELIKGISIRFNEKQVSLLELVTASYFTEDDEYRYGGNTSKNEAVLKVTSKISVARTLLYSRRGNFHIGVMVLDKDIINRAFSELPELMNRKSLGFVFISMPVDVDYALALCGEYDEVEVYACTKKHIENIGYDLSVNKNQNLYMKELSNQVRAIVHKKNIIVEVEDSPISLEDYRFIKKKLLQLKRDSYSSHEKDNFIIQAYSLLNFIMTSVFTIHDYENAKAIGTIEIEFPNKKIEQLNAYTKLFPNWLSEIAVSVIDILVRGLEKIVEVNKKLDWIVQYIISHSGRNIAIVVPKAYYIPILQNIINKRCATFSTIKIYTMGKFDQSKLYDSVIVVGDIETKNFNVTKCNSARKIISLLYIAEKKRYLYKLSEAAKKEKYINYKAAHGAIDEEPFGNNQVEETEAVLDEEINDYIMSIDALYNTYQSSVVNYRNNVSAEVVATAIFSDDSKAFLSKRYRGYVLDEMSGNVFERSVSEVKEGDSLIFTKNSNETKDIVDSILHQLIEEKKLTEQMTKFYKQSKRWKDVLINYMQRYGLTEREVATRMLMRGCAVQEVTLLIWLDEAAHTVGPRKVESIISIAEFVGDAKLKSEANEVFEACRQIRSLRRKILEQVGNAIVDKIAGLVVSEGSEWDVIYERVDSMAEVKHIERMSYVEQMVPINLVNRPLHI